MHLKDTGKSRSTTDPQIRNAFGDRPRTNGYPWIILQDSAWHSNQAGDEVLTIDGGAQQVLGERSELNGSEAKKRVYMFTKNLTKAKPAIQYHRTQKKKKSMDDDESFAWLRDNEHIQLLGSHTETR